MIVRLFRNGAILALLPALLSAQVVFSRRVYSQKGQTFQQIWLWNGAAGGLKRLTESPRNHFQPTCSIEGSEIRFFSGTELYNYDAVWSYDRRTGEERKVSGATQAPARRLDEPPISECSQTAAWAPGRRRFACPSGQDVLIYDAAAKKELGRAHFSQRPTPPSAVAWSPNGKWLLVGTQGENDNSTSRQADYFVLDPGRMAWIPAGSGNDAMWLPGANKILYTTPRDLVPLTPGSKHQVWSSHLVVFDPATARGAPVTSGVSNNVQPAPCARP